MYWHGRDHDVTPCCGVEHDYWGLWFLSRTLEDLTPRPSDRQWRWVTRLTKDVSWTEQWTGRVFRSDVSPKCRLTDSGPVYERWPKFHTTDPFIQRPKTVTLSTRVFYLRGMCSFDMFPYEKKKRLLRFIHWLRVLFVVPWSMLRSFTILFLILPYDSLCKNTLNDPSCSVFNSFISIVI